MRCTQLDTGSCGPPASNNNKNCSSKPYDQRQQQQVLQRRPFRNAIKRVPPGAAVSDVLPQL